MLILMFERMPLFQFIQHAVLGRLSPINSFTYRRRRAQTLYLAMMFWLSTDDRTVVWKILSNVSFLDQAQQQQNSPQSNTSYYMQQIHQLPVHYRCFLQHYHARVEKRSHAYSKFGKQGLKQSCLRNHNEDCFSSKSDTDVSILL